MRPKRAEAPLHNPMHPYDVVGWGELDHDDACSVPCTCTCVTASHRNGVGNKTAIVRGWHGRRGTKPAFQDVEGCVTSLTQD